MDQERAGKNYAYMGAIALLTIGCLYVLRPFLAAILFAAAIVISSWPIYLYVLARMRGRRTLAALTLTLTLTFLVILPIALVAYNLADDVGRFYEQLKAAVATGHVEPPAWLRQIPLVGETLYSYVGNLVSSREQMMVLAQRLLEPARHYLLGGGIVLGTGVAQMSLAAFVSFFLYRDGHTLLVAIGVAMQRIIGERAERIATTVSQTVRGVMYGLLGTALAQAVVAAIGFVIAGVPGVPLLAVATFVMSLVPVGPPIIWGGAAIWLFNQGQTGWGIFMVVWGLVLISGVDNVVKPMLISRGSSLPFLLVLLGVLGGVLAFGFVGLFIGPTLLAVGYSLMREWTGIEPAVVNDI
ncbi:AI-2E family transporter [Massilia sp. CCM 8733]|uniref:AI-2E family transporter n=1 Tax=Massilia mucilaginosa TaxID=2609282 RepID=A0ABX0NMN9_9BURK|nr:AI-2E family transporter [Massilia mucilaginosa]NHZ88066.1 AI-2E family transporter [Massilia mucilaginosa]